MSDDKITLFAARNEVHKTLMFSNFCTRKIAISFIDETPSTFTGTLKMVFWYVFSTGALIGLVAAEIAYVISCLIGNFSVATFVASLHIVGYGSISLCKCIMLWVKRSVFRQVINELVELWPVNIKDEETAELKRRSVTALRLVQFCYMCWTIGGALLYNIPQLVVYFYQMARGVPADLGFVWAGLYPFDKTKPVAHELVYIFEMFSGIVSVWAMLGSDLMFTTMASHISMLLRILQIKIRDLGHSVNNQVESSLKCGERNVEQVNVDCYDDIVSVIKIHQRLISYCKDLEDVFSVVNLVNVLLSSVNICCVVFNIVLLEPWMEMSNKFFLGATMTQVGIICWYADDIFRASVGVADAVYSSGWYKTNTRCRRALLLLLQRSQKPVCFTALKFQSITMSTYNSVLTTSYSYFALLYTIYSN